VAAYVLDRRFGLARGFDLYDDRIDRRTEGSSILESERPCEEVVAGAAAWIAPRAASSDPPWLAWVHLYDPHAPYDPPPPLREAFAGRLYEGEVARTDACVGRLLAALPDPARTVVAVVADHGEGLGDHGERTHGLFVYQSTLRVPMILAGPGLPAGRRLAGPARTVDLLPTLLGRLGVGAPARLDGIDLFASAPADTAYAETLYPRSLGWAPLRSVRVGALKYVDAPRPELFDLSSDPQEARELSASRPADLERLRQALRKAYPDDARDTARAMDAETAERLRALGYAAAAPPPAAAGPLLDPKDALPLWHLFEEANAADARGDLDAALRALRDLVSRAPGNATFRRSLSAALRRAGRPQDAVAAMAGLLETAPDDAVAWHEHAAALAAAGRVDEAIRCEERATALNPTLPEPFNHLGVLHASRGRAAEALRAFETATTLDPNNAQAWNNRGNALRELGRRQEAEQAYSTAHRLAPRDVDPLNGLGALAVEAGRLDAAAAYFERALEMRPDNGDANLNLAFVDARRGALDRARARLLTLLAGGPRPDVASRARRLLHDLGPP
jgi:Flp pilus assembly protein TadD